MISVAVGEMLWLFSCSQIRGRPEERDACVEGGSGRERSVDVAGMGWVEVQRFCGSPFFTPLGAKPVLASGEGYICLWLCPPLFSSVLPQLY